MRAGPLRASVSFQRRAKGANVGGVVRADWAPLCGPYPCRAQPTGKNEMQRGELIEQRDGYMIRLRGFAAVLAVTTSDRVVVTLANGQAFTANILQIQNPDERGREMIFAVVAGGADG